MSKDFYLNEIFDLLLSDDCTETKMVLILNTIKKILNQENSGGKDDIISG